MSENCEQCGHDFNPHAMVATGETPIEGGVVLCPVKDCDCYATWCVEQAGGTREAIRIPDAFELLALRERFQT